MSFVAGRLVENYFSLRFRQHIWKFSHYCHT